MASPRFVEDPAYRCLRMGDFAGFRREVEGRPEIDFSDAEFRGIDLRGADLSRVVLRGAYLRDADLRGVDLRHMDLEGCSLLGARISGTYFPSSLSAQEIANSVQLGTRLRMSC
jgi:uncharacterized protein YjbI with pentapeptide repeats